jgi:ATP-dependent protease ClpP protease subunit
MLLLTYFHQNRKLISGCQSDIKEKRREVREREREVNAIIKNNMKDLCCDTLTVMVDTEIGVVATYDKILYN